jgi:hypothetical protein
MGITVRRVWGRLWEAVLFYCLKGSILAEEWMAITPLYWLYGLGSGIPSLAPRSCWKEVHPPHLR